MPCDTLTEDKLWCIYPGKFHTLIYIQFQAAPFPSRCIIWQHRILHLTHYSEWHAGGFTRGSSGADRTVTAAYQACIRDRNYIWPPRPLYSYTHTHTHTHTHTRTHTPYYYNKDRQTHMRTPYQSTIDQIIQRIHGHHSVTKLWL